MHDETSEVMDTLIFTWKTIKDSGLDDQRKIANAYAEAQYFVEQMDLEDSSAQPRIVACLVRFKDYQAAGDVAAAAWMLTALQGRIDEKNLPHWEKLKAIADQAETFLRRVRRLQ